MMTTEKNIEAIVEVYPSETIPPWETVSTNEFFRVVLSSATNDEEIGSVMLVACEYNRVKIENSAEKTLENFLSKNFVLPGGLQFSENGVVKIFPGCCCGLENWREWLGVPNGDGVWAGHDPSPFAEFIDEKIRVWQDEKADDVNFIDFEYDELRKLLEKTEKDLNDFIFKLNRWTEFYAPSLKDEVSRHFTRNMQI